MGMIIKGVPTYRGVPKELVLSIRDNAGYKSFVETGTYQGKTSIWASQFFDMVYTCEASIEIFKKLDLSHYTNINSSLGVSADFLPRVLSEPSIIYLDAHNSGGETFKSYPLLNELDIINSSPFEHSIIVDDARFCVSYFNTESYGELSEIVNKMAYKNRYLIMFEDMLIAVPRQYRAVIDDYTNAKSKAIIGSRLNVIFSRISNLMYRLFSS